MKLKDISRTATFAWDQSSSSSPLLATGAVAGALDESFSNDSQLEIWAPQFGDGQSVRLGGEGSSSEGSITIGSRFNRLAWSAPYGSYAKGVLAAGMETGEINVFDPEKILGGSSADQARIFQNSKHSGPVRGLDFNPIQKNVLLSGGIKAELLIFDLNSPSAAPKPPGPLSTKLNEITSLQWNPTVARIFAASSSSGYTSVWDLRAEKEIVSLQYGGGAAKGQDVVGGAAGLQMGKRRGMSDVCWHPEQATRLITASEDDESPIIMLWDLRNTRAPERILSGHHKGVLSVAWCKQDADLLLSCGKDNRTLCWNPHTGEIIGELPSSKDWSFQTSWCPRNPDLLATASFDGHIGIHSLQTTSTLPKPSQQMSETATADDLFGALGNETSTDDTDNILSLSQPPKWLRRPVSASFGFGGLLASTSNLPGANGKHQSGVVHLRSIVTEQIIIDRANAWTETAGDEAKITAYCADKASRGDTAWRTLQALFKADSRDELIALLGFSKQEVATQVHEAIKKLQNTQEEPDSKVEVEKDDNQEASPSEISLASGSTKQTEGTAFTEQSLFDDHTPGTPAAADADFFSSMAAGTLRNPQLDNVIPHKPVGAESSAAATIGSRASSVRSETVKDNNTFHIYPDGESEVDRLITQALVLGDFASAVDLCLASDRYADAFLLAVRGGPELLASTQKAYFAKRTVTTPFLRVYQSIVTEDLTDIVQNADLGEWKAAFVVLCTFAKGADFPNLAEQMGQRLQFKWQMLSSSDSPEAKTSAKSAREDATLCYVAARKLEKLVGIWSDELREEEESTDTTQYTAHALALQSFIEKVAVFTAATKYVDDDLMHPTQSAATAEAGTRTYKLSGLYDRFYEYADLLATQGLVDIAAKYVQMTPPDYKGTGAGGSELDKARDRLLKAAAVDVQVKTKAKAAPIAGTGYASAQSGAGYAPAQSGAGYAPAQSGAGYAPTQSGAGYAPTQSGAGYAPAQSTHKPPTYGVSSSSSFAPPSVNSFQPPANSAVDSPYGAQQQPYVPQGAYAATSQYTPSQSYQNPPSLPSQSYQTASPYAPVNGYSSQTPSSGYGATQGPPQTSLGPPPRAGGSINTPPPVPAAQRRDMPGWNDAPSLSAPPKRPQSAAKEVKPIMSPFPMSIDPLAQAGMVQGTTSPSSRGQPGMLPPPPKGGPRPPSAQAVARAAIPQAPPARPPPSAPSQSGPPRGGPPPGVLAGPPPPRVLSPLGPGRMASPSIQSQLRPTQSPPGPPPPGSRMAGPPPPGRQSVPTAPTPAPVPSRSAYPPGDRSHIPASSRPIYDTLQGELTRVQNGGLPVHLKKIIDDTERRLNILFDGLNNETVPKDAVNQMNNIAKAMAAKDANGALAMHVQLLTNASGEMTAWAPGVKQLIRLGI